MKKWKTLGMSLLPVCLWLLLQIMLSTGFSTMLVLLSVFFKGRGVGRIFWDICRQKVFIFSPVVLTEFFLYLGFFGIGS